MILTLVVIAGGFALKTAATRQGFRKMASAIEQVGQALAGAHSAAFEQLEADIRLAATQLATKDARITELEGLLAAATAGTSDADLGTLDALLKPALDPVAPAAPPAATATPVTVPDNPPPAPAAPAVPAS